MQLDSLHCSFSDVHGGFFVSAKRSLIASPWSRNQLGAGQFVGLICSRGDQKLGSTVVLKRHMKVGQVDVNAWERMAMDTKVWCCIVQCSKQAVEE